VNLSAFQSARAEVFASLGPRGRNTRGPRRRSANKARSPCFDCRRQPQRQISRFDCRASSDQINLRL